LAKNATHKKDKDSYRPWRNTIPFYGCYSCGKKLLEKNGKFCQDCRNKLGEGYDLW